MTRASPTLEIRMLGAVGASRDGRALTLGGPQARLLLAFLVHARGRELGHADLVEALWGEAPPDHPEVGLRAALSKQRSTLGVSLLAGRLPAHVRLPDGVQLDVATMEAAVEAAERFLANGQATQAFACARTALSLDRGPFAAGLEAEWLEDARRSQQVMRERALEAAARAELQFGAPTVAGFGIEAAEELCRCHPYMERAHVLLMRLLVAAGDRIRALSVYEELRARLREDLGLIPAQELRERHSQLVADERGAGKAPSEYPRRATEAPSGSDLRLALDAVVGWYEAASPSDLAAAALSDLHRLVPCDGVGWNDIDLVPGDVKLLVSPIDYEVGSLEALNRLIHQNPIVAHTERTGGGQGVLKFSDFTTALEFHRLEIYREFYGPLGVEDQLALPLEVSPRQIIAIAFNRDRRSFSERDRQLLQLLRPHLLSAYRNLWLRLEAEGRLAALERGREARGVAALSAEGRIEDLDHHARELLESWFGRLPASITAGTYHRAGAELHVRAIFGEPPLLLLNERPNAPASSPHTPPPGPGRAGT